MMISVVRIVWGRDVFVSDLVWSTLCSCVRLSVIRRGVSGKAGSGLCLCGKGGGCITVSVVWAV